MIKTYSDKQTKKFAETGKSNKIPVQIVKRAQMRLDRINAAIVINDLRMPPSHKLEKLSGKRQGQYSIRINQQWRICFKFKDGSAFDVEIIDYH